MRETRNPFKLRRAENIDDDTSFISLFEPGILEVLNTGLPETVQLIRSAAGGGKTSLLRLFTPSVLRRLHSRRVEDQDLFSRLKALGAIDDQGPRLLGVTLLCGRNYAGLEDLRLEPLIRKRLFLGLLNARIVLAVLRSALGLRGLEYPKDLIRMSVLAPATETNAIPVDLPCSGQVLYDWARAVEKSICSALDSFGPLEAHSLPGQDTLFSLAILQPDSLRIDNTPVADRVVLMMDDIHMLTSPQRELLLLELIEARSKIGIWIAERFEALTTQELLASGSAGGRDHDATIELEWFWRGRSERFEKHVMRVADRRVKASVETELDGFRSSLEEDLEGPTYASLFDDALRVTRDRVLKRAGDRALFSEWVGSCDRAVGTVREKANRWRALEILIERTIRRPQKSLFDAPLPSGQLSDLLDSAIRNAAELFLAREFKIPYYFGSERIARLASLNIEQFLGLSGAIFEEVIAAELLGSGTTVISARRQHDLMKKAAQAFWNDIPNKVRHGREVRALLDSVGRFSAWYTYRPTAPNDPGVGGTAIRMSERSSLMNGGLSKNPDGTRFADLLASALAHNYLVADLDYKCKGDLWMVLNLNRLLCVHFDLPLGYGLYKERPLAVLSRWVDEPFVAPRQDEWSDD